MRRVLCVILIFLPLLILVALILVRGYTGSPIEASYQIDTVSPCARYYVEDYTTKSNGDLTMEGYWVTELLSGKSIYRQKNITIKIKDTFNISIKDLRVGK